MFFVYLINILILFFLFLKNINNFVFLFVMNGIKVDLDILVSYI